MPILFFIIALVYSSVGFGGGSSYIAALALFAQKAMASNATDPEMRMDIPCI